MPLDPQVEGLLNQIAAMGTPPIASMTAFCRSCGEAYFPAFRFSVTGGNVTFILSSIGIIACSAGAGASTRAPSCLSSGSRVG